MKGDAPVRTPNPRRARGPNTPRPAADPGPPVLTEPRLAALLLYVSGSAGDDDGRIAGDFAATLADTREVLARQPLTNTFDWRLPRRCVEDQVRAAVAAKIARGDERFRCGAGELFLDALNGDTEETIAIERGALETLVWDHLEAALLRGACVMYCLLKDGAR